MHNFHESSQTVFISDPQLMHYFTLVCEILKYFLISYYIFDNVLEKMIFDKKDSRYMKIDLRLFFINNCIL